MALDGARAEDEAVGDLSVGEAGSQLAQVGIDEAFAPDPCFRAADLDGGREHAGDACDGNCG